MHGHIKWQLNFGKFKKLFDLYLGFGICIMQSYFSFKSVICSSVWCPLHMTGWICMSCSFVEVLWNHEKILQVICTHFILLLLGNRSVVLSLHLLTLVLVNVGLYKFHPKDSSLRTHRHHTRLSAIDLTHCEFCNKPLLGWVKKCKISTPWNVDLV